MTLKELASLVASDINSRTRSVTASVDKDGNLVLTVNTFGTDHGLVSSAFYEGTSPDPQTLIGDVATYSGGGSTEVLKVIGNKGDTYFQRWDSMKTYPQGDDDNNQVIDIASVMVESHINLDGRTDLDRGVSQLADIDYTKFGSMNMAYSQPDDFLSGIDYDDAFNLDTYRASVTWTMQKNAGSEIDEWTHITLTNSLALDGDKGPIHALRRFNNNIISFQSRGIAEILFNSRTQLTTEEGVPVEIANSGKVDGKRYVTNKYGTMNKWSVLEGKSGVYFVDNTNKIIGRLGANGVESLSTKNGFDAWVRSNHSVEPWTPAHYNNFVTYYDRIHSDVYFVKSSENEDPCLVYNELLDAFTGFFDYSNVPMMVNLEDRFISFYDNSIWLQNEGLYCDLFDETYPFWTTWRVNPDGLTDKIWTNIEYRADFITALDSDGTQTMDEASYMLGDNSIYNDDETFDHVAVWNEYQTTGEVPVKTCSLRHFYPDVRKKFRIWRIAIPRAEASLTYNKFGLDRIRNPWVFVKLKKNSDNFDSTMLMQLHDVAVKYFTD